MGYTHYWKIRGTIDPENWANIVDDAKKLVEKSPVKIVYEYDTTDAPQVNDSAIHLNGQGDDGHETFCLMPGMTDFEFCKTANKPYDLIVCAILAVAASHTNYIRVTSDGEPEDWAEAMVYASSILGRPIVCPLPVELPF